MVGCAVRGGEEVCEEGEGEGGGGEGECEG